MGKILRAWLAAAAFAAIGFGCALITGFGLGPAQAASCTPHPVTDKMNVQVSPNANVRAFATLKASFSGSISNGHCAGDSFSFAIPPTLTAQDGASYPLKAPDGSLVATLVIHGRQATVTLTKFVETHTHVTVQGFFNARIDDSTSPGGTDNIVWDVNGKSTTPVHMAGCPNCSKLPTRTTKNGALAGTNGITIGVNTIPSTAANQVFTFTDTLTSPGQRFDCPTTATANLYKSRNQWGVPIYTQRGVPVTITACSSSSVSGSVKVPDAGMAARIGLHVTITDPSQSAYTDTVQVVTNGHGQSASTSVQQFNGGGSGNGTTGSASASPSITTRTSTSPAGGSSGASASSSNRNFPTAINGGGGPARSSGSGSVVTGIALLVAGVLGIGLIALRAGLVGGARGRHGHR